MADEVKDQNPTPEDIKNIRDEYKRTKKIIENIKTLYGEYGRLNNMLNDENTGVNATYNKILSRQKEIDTIRENSQTRLTEIEDNLKKVKNNINEMQNAYTAFSEIKGKVEGKNNEINGIKDTSDGLKRDIERIKADSQKTLDQISGLLQEVQNKIKELNTAYNNFLTVKGKIDDKNDGLQALMDRVQATNSKSSEVLKQIQDYRDESSKFLGDIKSNFEETETVKEEINKNQEEINKKRIEIEEVTGLVVTTGFASSFQTRAKSLQRSSYFWVGVFLTGVICLAATLIYFFHDLKEIPGAGFVFYRITLSSPLLFLIGFAMKQYSNDRSFNEKYAFKFSIAAVIQNHVDFLLKTFPKEEKAIMTFCEAAWRMLYKEPYGVEEDIHKKIDQIFEEIKEIKKLNSKNAPTTNNNLLKYIGEIKKIIPDVNIYKQLIELIQQK